MRRGILIMWVESALSARGRLMDRVKCAGGRRGVGEAGSAFDGNREIQKRRRPGRLELALDGFVDNLLHVRAASAAAKAGARRACHVTSRGSAVSNETANLAISDSAAMANEHRMDHSWRS